MPAASVLAAPLVIAQQGIFSAGGTVLTSPGTFRPEDQWERSGAGQTAHVDHANVLYQIPQKKAGAPLVFLHGYGQSRMGWMTTPDGREGWSDYFLRRGHAVFLIDEPHRGEAGSTSIPGTISSRTLEQRWYTQFRIGRWENGRSVPYRGSQFPNDAASLDQFFRQMTPDTGMKSDMGADFALDIVAKATAAVMDKTYQRTVLTVDVFVPCKKIGSIRSYGFHYGKIIPHVNMVADRDNAVIKNVFVFLDVFAAFDLKAKTYRRNRKNKHI